MARYFKNSELKLYMKVASEAAEDTGFDAQDKGFMVRVFANGAEQRFESTTFGNRTKQYIVDGLSYGNVVEIEMEEFVAACRQFYTWAQNQIKNNFIV